MSNDGQRRQPALRAALALIALAGCGGSTPPVSLSAPKQKISHRDYEKIRGRWTRDSRIIKKLDTTLRVHATLFSPELNAAYAARRAHMFKLPARERADLERQLNADWSESFVFLVAAATIDQSWNDFGEKRSVWRVSLASERGDQVTASSIRSEPVNATLKELFPFIGRFHKVYFFRFPRTLPDGGNVLGDSAREVKLRFAGALGQTELVWRIQ